MNAMKPKAIDLFCECGGLTLGLKLAGFEVIVGIECEPLAIVTYQLNHPDTYIFKNDIRTIDARTLQTRLNLKPGKPDLLAGCPPCQGFSTHRTYMGRYSIEDERNDLINDFLRIALELKPKAIMMENVPGLAKDCRFEYFHKTLEKEGYHCSFKILNAQDYGVPQRRKRLIFVATTTQMFTFPISDDKKVTIRDAISRLPIPGTGNDPIHDLPEKRSPRIQEIIKLIPKNGGSRTSLDEKYQLNCHKVCEGFRDVYGRMAWDDVAPTITGGCVNPSKGRFLHPEQDRAVTLREVALLQSFPADYKFPLSKGKYAVAAMIGNALPPRFIQKISVCVRNILQ